MLARFVLMMALAAAGDAPQTLDEAAARDAFRELDALCRRDGGKLWGAPLCGPMMIVDPQTRAFVANTDPQAGTLPQDQNASNTSFEWRGVHWSQVVWPLPADADQRHVLLLHESFHRIQDRVLPVPALGDNGHLDALEGRVLLQLEWRALRAALASKADARRSAIEDALAFRAARRAKFLTVAAKENALELQEGLAEYTGVKLAASSPQQEVALALSSMDTIAGFPSFVRSFAYASGPAYGLLLDAARPGWRKSLSAKSDLGQLLAAATHLRVGAEYPEHTDARAARYDGKALRMAEQKHAEELKARVDEYRRLLVDGPVLRLELQWMKIQLQPGTLVAFGERGTVYPSARIVAPWGVLSASGGVLIAPDWKTAFVSAPAAGELKTDRWTIELASGWAVVPGERAGDYRLRSPEAVPAQH